MTREEFVTATGVTPTVWTREVDGLPPAWGASYSIFAVVRASEGDALATLYALLHDGTVPRIGADATAHHDDEEAA